MIPSVSYWIYGSGYLNFILLFVLDEGIVHDGAGFKNKLMGVMVYF
jgi:hypothetical protein